MPVITREPEEHGPEHEVIYTHDNGRTDTERRAIARPSTGMAAAMTAGPSLELIAGAGAVVLAILALAGFLPTSLAAISTIAMGGGLLAHGVAMGPRGAELMRRRTEAERVEVGGGLGSEVFGGIAAIVLGILALARVQPLLLLPVAAIVLGGSLLLSAPAQPELARFASDADRRAGKLTYEAVEGSSGAMILAGIGAIVLGILALLRIGPPITLVNVAVLGIGSALLLGGTALAVRFGRRLSHA